MPMGKGKSTGTPCSTAPCASNKLECPYLLLRRLGDTLALTLTLTLIAAEAIFFSRIMSLLLLLEMPWHWGWNAVRRVFFFHTGLTACRMHVVPLGQDREASPY